MKRKALGKGLSALLPDPEPAAEPGERTAEVAVDRLEPNPFQPRLKMDPAALKALAESVREVPDERLLELALVENIQREELTALEEAQAYVRLQEELRLTQEQVAQKV